jgi:hypothetical protein
MSETNNDVATDEEIKATPETGPSPDSEAAILSKVMSLETAFGMKEGGLAKLYVSYGNTAREKLDPSDSGRTYVTLGHMAFQILSEEHRLNPSGFKRSAVSTNIKNAGSYAGVPDSRNLPHEFLSSYWLARLVQSTPGEPGMSRTWGPDLISDDFYGGNLTYAALRLLFPTMKQEEASDSELEVREFKPGWEAWTRQIVSRLRQGQLTCAMVKALYDAKKEILRKEEERERHGKMTPEQIKSEKQLLKAKNREKKLNALGSDALTLAESAQEVLSETARLTGQSGKSVLADFLVTKGVIDKPKTKTVYDWADEMTGGDAKALVQRLDEKGRSDILVTLWLNLKNVADLTSLTASKTELRVTGTDG